MPSDTGGAERCGGRKDWFERNERRLSPVLLAQGRHSELLQSRRDICSRAVRVDASVDVEDLAFGVDIVSPAVRQFTLRRYDPIGPRDAFVGIAQDRIVERERFGEFLVSLDRVTARGEVVDRKSTDFVAALTERLAFGRSTTGKRFRKPRKDHSLAP